MKAQAALVVSIVLLLASPAIAGERENALFAAARGGDLDKVKTLVEDGVAADAADRWGLTPLAMAAGAGHREIVAWLLERGADPNRAETFYGRTALQLALFHDHRGIARMLLENGADEREMALGFALREGDLELAVAAVESGPIRVSQLEPMRARADQLAPELRAVLERAKSRPDPPPPKLSPAELEPFAGRFEGWDSDLEAAVEIREGKLVLSVAGTKERILTPSAENVFRDAEGVEVSFFGRAGGIEGLLLPRDDGPPRMLRRSVAELAPADRAKRAAADAESSAAVEIEPKEPTVHWPSFRGDGARGIGDGDEVPVRWDLESGDNVRWRVEVPGLGNSSPVVWGDRVFLTTAVAAGKEQELRTGLTGDGASVDEAVEHSWRVLAYDKENGELLWQTEIGRGVPESRRHFKASQASSTAATDGEHLVVVFPTAGIACLDLGGKVRWKHDLGPLNAGAFYDPGVQWGFASSPLIYGSSVILQADVHGGAFLAAWDLESGQELWRVPRDVAPSWATPTIVRGPEGDELVVNGSTIRGYDPRTGRELWSLAPNSELVIATPVAADGVVYVSAGYPPVKPIYALRVGTRGALELEPGAAHERLLWSHSRGGAYMPTPLLYRGLLYVVHHNGRLVVYDATSGDAIYKGRFSRGGVFTASPVAANGRIYLPTEEGLLYVLAASPPDFRELAVNDLGAPLMATPAISEGILLVRTPKQLIAIGAPALETAAPAQTSSSFPVSSGRSVWGKSLPLQSSGSPEIRASA